MKYLRQYIRTILEASTPENDERSETYKIIQLFLSEYGTMQAIELAEMLPDVDPNVIDLMQIIQSRVEEIIEYGRGNFPGAWAKDPKMQRYGRGEEPYLGPLVKAIRELRYIAETEAPGDDESRREFGKASIKLGTDFQRAMRAANLVIRGKLTPEEMMNSQGKARRTGKSFVELAERFGIHL